MTAPAPSLGDQVAANISGQRAAHLALEQVRGHTAHPEALFVKAVSIQEEQGAAALLGFMRVVQKAIERSQPPT